MRSIIFSILLIIGSRLVSAQSFHRYAFNRISRTNGLVSDDVTSVAQDSSGYIWISTNNGLQRFDGKRFRTFLHEPDDSFSLPPEGVSRLLYDQKKRLWILTAANKIGIFDIKTLKFKRVQIEIEPEFRTNQILNFKEEKDGHIYLLIHKYGMLTFDEKRQVFSRSSNPVPVIGKNYPLYISLDNITGDYYVTSLSGFDIFRKDKNELESRAGNPFLTDINKFLKDQDAFGPVNITQDHIGRLWASVWSNKTNGPDLICYDTSRHKWTSYQESVSASAKGYHEMAGILVQKNGSIWIYGNNLFAKLNTETNSFEDVRNEGLQSLSVPFEAISQMYEDKDENIWISANNGLYIFNPQKQFISTFTNKRLDGIERHFPVDVITETQSGNIYTTIWGYGIFSYDNNFKPVANSFLPEMANVELSVWDMHERKNGDLWMGVQSGMLYISEGKSKKLYQFKPRAVEDHTIRQVNEDSAGNVWLGTQSGLVIKCINGNWRDSIHSFKTVLRVNAHILKLYTDNKGMLWVCTDRDGLYRIDPASEKTLEHFTDLSPAGFELGSVHVTDIMQYEDSLFLIASGGINILNLPQRTMRKITVADGLPSNDIVCFTTDKQGNIWLGSQSGPYRMNLKNKFYFTFGAEDGIIFGRRKITVVETLRDGRIVFGSSSDMLIVHPDKIKLADYAPPVALADLKVFDKRRSVDSINRLNKIILSHNENSLTIDLTTYTYSNSPAILYMLEGVDKSWKTAIQNQITYNYLAPGNYLLRAKSVVASGKESDQIFEIWIEIEPPFWKSWWFYGLLILVGIAILYLLDVERMNKLRSNQQLRTDIALNLHDEINSTLGNINLLSEMALRKADTNTERSKELIGQIRHQSNDMIIAMDDMLWSIDPDNDSMEKTLLRMNEFIDALKSRHDAAITMHTAPSVEKLKPDMKVRHGFFTVFKEALRLICQHSGGKNIQINIDLVKNNLVLKLQDQVKVNTADLNVSKNIGNMELHAKQIDAELDIHTDPERTQIILTAPLA